MAAKCLVVDPVVVDLRRRLDQVLGERGANLLLALRDLDRRARDRMVLLPQCSMLEDDVVAFLADDCADLLVVHDRDDVIAFHAASLPGIAAGDTSFFTAVLLLRSSAWARRPPRAHPGSWQPRRGTASGSKRRHWSCRIRCTQWPVD